MEKEISEYQKFYNEISKKYKIKSSGIPNLSEYYLFNSNHAPQVYNGIRVSDTDGRNCNLHIVGYENRPYKEDSMSIGTFDHYSNKYLFGRLLLKSDWGDAVIKPEKLSDKIREFFKKEEIDFETHKKFSFKYYVLSKQAEKFREKMTPDILDFLQNTNGLTIEFRNRTCIFKLPKSIDYHESHELLQIGLELHRLLGGRH